MDPHYAAAYRDLYERHWWWRARERFLLDRLESQAEEESRLTRRLLDVGCGDALFFDRLSEFGRVQGIEPDTEILSDGPWRDQIHGGTLESFSADVPFDWILMLDVLEHLSEPGEALRRARDVATEQASLFVTVPAFEALWTQHDELNRHYVRYDRTSLEILLLDSGWQPMETTYFFIWLVPLKMLLKLKETLLRGQPGIEKVPPTTVNKAAYVLSRLEQRLFSGLRIPFGTSLYVRARPMSVSEAG